MLNKTYLLFLFPFLFVGCKTLEPMEKIIEVEKQVEVVIEKQTEIIKEVELLPESPQKEIVKIKVVEQIKEIEKLVYIVEQAKDETGKLLHENVNLKKENKGLKLYRNITLVVSGLAIAFFGLLIVVKK